ATAGPTTPAASRNVVHAKLPDMRGRVAGILSFAFVLLGSAVDLSGGATVNNHATVSALDLATGNQEWSARLPKPEVTDAPAAGPRGVYVKSQAAGREVCNFGGHSTLTAFAPSSGHVQWRWIE